MEKNVLFGGTALLAAFVGIVIFVVGNWTNWIAPEGLTPMAWVSSMALVVAAVMGALWWLFKVEDIPAACAFFCAEGIILSCIGFLLWCNECCNPAFAGAMFGHPFAGVACIGLFAMTVILALQATDYFKSQDIFVAWFELICAVMMFALALAIGGAAWVIPINLWWQNAFAYVVIICVIIFFLMFMGLFIAKKY